MKYRRIIKGGKKIYGIITNPEQLSGYKLNS